MKSTLRLLILLCYFFPFTFFVAPCNGLELRVAYNEREAKANEAAAMQAEVQSTASDTVQISEVSTAYTSKAVDMAKDLNDSTQPIGEHHDKTEFWWELLGRVLIPTDTSLSAVGSIFYYIFIQLGIMIHDRRKAYR